MFRSLDKNKIKEKDSGSCKSQQRRFGVRRRLTKDKMEKRPTMEGRSFSRTRCHWQNRVGKKHKGVGFTWNGVKDGPWRSSMKTEGPHTFISDGQYPFPSFAFQILPFEIVSLWIHIKSQVQTKNHQTRGTVIKTGPNPSYWRKELGQYFATCIKRRLLK